MIGEYLIKQLNALRQSDTLCDLDLISGTGACFPVHHVVFVCLNQKHFELAQRDRISRARHQSGGRRKMMLTQMCTEELDVLVQFMYGTPISKRSRYEKLETALEKLHMGYLLQEAGDFTLEYDVENTANEEVQGNQDMEEDSKDPLSSLTVSFPFDKMRSTSENVASQSSRHAFLPGSTASCKQVLREPATFGETQNCDTGAAESIADHVDNSRINSPPIEESVTDVGNRMVDAVKQEPADGEQNLVPDSGIYESILCNIDIKPECGQSGTISSLSGSVEDEQAKCLNDKESFGTRATNSASAVDAIRAALSTDSHTPNKKNTKNKPNRCIIGLLESGAQARLSDTDNMNSSVSEVIDNARDTNSSQTGYPQNLNKNVSYMDDMILTVTSSISEMQPGLVETKTSLNEQDVSIRLGKNNQQHSKSRLATSCHNSLSNDGKDREATCDNSVQNMPVIPHSKQISSSMSTLGLSPESTLPPSNFVSSSVFSEKPHTCLIISPRKQANVSQQSNHLDEANFNQVMEKTEALLKKQRMLLPKPASPSKTTCLDGASTHVETNKCSNVAKGNAFQNAKVGSDHLYRKSAKTLSSRETKPTNRDSSEGSISQTVISNNPSVAVVKPTNPSTEVVKPTNPSVEVVQPTNPSTEVVRSVHAPVSKAQSEKVLAVLAKLSPILQHTKEIETSPSVKSKTLQSSSEKGRSREEVLSSNEGFLPISSSPNTRPEDPFPVLKKMLSPAVVRRRDIPLDLPFTQLSTPAKQTKDNSTLCKYTGTHSPGKKRKQTCTCSSVASSCSSEKMPQKRRKSITTMHLKQSPDSEDENVPLSRLLQKLNDHSPITCSYTRESKEDIPLNVEEGSVHDAIIEDQGQISLTEDNEQYQSSVGDSDTHENTSQENTDNASFIEDSGSSSEHCSLDEPDFSKKLASQHAANAEPGGDLGTYTQQEDQMVDLTTDDGSNLTLDLSNVGIPNVIIETPVMRRESLAIRSPELARLLSASVNLVRLGKGGKKKRQYQSKKKQCTAKDNSGSLKVKRKKVHLVTEGHAQNFQLHMSNFRTIYPKPSCPTGVSTSNSVERATEVTDETENNKLDQVRELYQVDSSSDFSALGTQKISSDFIINHNTSLDHCQRIKKIKMNKRVLDHRKSSKGANGLSKHGSEKKRQNNCDGETISVSTAVIVQEDDGHKEMLTNTENEPTSGNIVVCDVQMNEKICKKKLM